MNLNLPICSLLDEIKSTLEKNNTLILQSPTGSGKSTVVPLAFLDEPWLENKKIIMLEPRRVAARAVAARMAQSLNEKVGQRVGYRVKMESCVSRSTKIEVVTEAILTRMLQNDQSLEDVALVIFDEFHERSIHTDLTLALSLQVQELLRDDLKLLIMSATLDSKKLIEMLGSVPVLTSQGKSYHIEYEYLPLNIKQPSYKELNDTVSSCIFASLKNDTGDILVFLPGIKNINEIKKILDQKLQDHIVVMPLHSGLTKKEQDTVISPNNKRKIILSTNIAQTSLTIEGVKVVIDTGLEKISFFNHANDMDRLEQRFISKQSALQRAGRAGRTSNGKCYRLWHEKKMLEESSDPEILRVDLTSFILETQIWGADDTKELKLLDQPPKEIVDKTKDTLEYLGMLDTGLNITPYAQKSIKLGLHPRYSFLVLQSIKLGYPYEACILTAILEDNQKFRSYDDIYHIFLEFKKQKEIKKRADHYFEKLQKLENVSKSNKNIPKELIGVMLLYAYPNRLARQREKNTNIYKLSNGKGTLLDDQSTLFNEEFLVIPRLNTNQNSSFISLACSISKTDIEKYFSHLIEIKKDISYDKKNKKFSVRENRWFLSLMIDSKPLGDNDIDLSDAMLGLVKEQGLGMLNWDKKALALKQRVNFVNSHLKDTSLPNFEENCLLENIKQWLKPYLNNIRSIKELESLDIHNILLGQIPWDKQLELESLAPEHIKVPSGSKIKIDYADPKTPVLAVKIQEMFGLKDTPKVLKGEVALQIHLLSPAARPVQITYDLKSFWENSYGEVVKELKGKYKKHYWPDDPMEAQATRKTKKFMDKQ